MRSNGIDMPACRSPGNSKRPGPGRVGVDPTIRRGAARTTATGSASNTRTSGMTQGSTAAIVACSHPAPVSRATNGRSRTEAPTGGDLGYATHTEDRHHGIADELLHAAAVALDDSLHPLEVAGKQGPQGLRLDRLPNEVEPVSRRTRRSPPCAAHAPA